MNLPPPPQTPESPEPVSEDELQAWVDGQLPVARLAQVQAYLASRPEEARRLESYRAQRRGLHALFDPVLDEPVPQRLLLAAWPRQPAWAGRWAAAVAGLGIAAASAAGGWALRGASQEGEAVQMAAAAPAARAAGFAQRAAVAHAVYSPDQRRAVELDAEHQAQLVTWLTKRLGSPVKVPDLRIQGYELEGGRLLPGGGGPVAQFMYRQPGGERLTLYLSNEVEDLGALATATAGPARGSAASGAGGLASSQPVVAFRFARLGSVNVFYWVGDGFGYALSADVDRGRLADVAGEVYRQMALAH